MQRYPKSRIGLGSPCEKPLPRPIRRLEFTRSRTCVKTFFRSTPSRELQAPPSRICVSSRCCMPSSPANQCRRPPLVPTYVVRPSPAFVHIAAIDTPSARRRPSDHSLRPGIGSSVSRYKRYFQTQKKPPRHYLTILLTCQRYKTSAGRFLHAPAWFSISCRCSLVSTAGNTRDRYSTSDSTD
jgi:hypothetical protein